MRCGAMFEEALVRGHESKLSPVFRDFLARAHFAGPLTADELLTAWAEADIIRHKLLEQMREFSLLLMPRRFGAGVPPSTSESGPSTDRQVEYLDAMRYTQWFNLLAAPAAVVPVGRSPEGLPDWRTNRRPPV